MGIMMKVMLRMGIMMKVVFSDEGVELFSMSGSKYVNYT